MEQYIDKSALVAEIERKKIYAQTLGDNAINSSMQQFYDGMKEACDNLLNVLDTLEVKDANEALRTEYEKGRADVIADTLSWLENCWPQYCDNPNIIEGFKEAIKD